MGMGANLEVDLELLIFVDMGIKLYGYR